MTLVDLLERARAMLTRGPVDVRELIDSFGFDDMEANTLLNRAFHARLLRGHLRWSHFASSGHITGIADDTRPVWH